MAHYIIWDESLALLVPTHPRVEKRLTFQQRDMIPDFTKASGFRVEIKTQRAYSLLQKDPKLVSLQTHAGFLEIIMQTLDEAGVEYTTHDTRPDFPEARLDLMHGFRFNQKELLTAALVQNKSGMIGAPTRFGKSYLMLNILRAYPGICSAVIAPGADLVTQSFKFLKQHLPRRDVRQLGGGSNRTYGSEDLTVCSMDSMHKLDHGRVKFVIVDEPHALVTENRYESFLPLMHARKISLGATLDGRFDGRDILMTGLLGSVLSKVTFKEACTLGAICPIVVIGIRYRLPHKKVKTKNQARKRFLFENEEVRDMIAYISNKIIPPSWQTMTFISNEAQGEFLRDTIEGQTLIMAKRCTKIVRSIYNGMMQASTVTRALVTKMYAQGVTFSHARVMINAEPGGASISAVQKAGRLAEVRPHKRCGVVFEIFYDTPPHLNLDDINSGQYMWTSLIRDSRAKMAMYQKLGYEVHVVESLEEAHRMFNEKAL